MVGLGESFRNMGIAQLRGLVKDFGIEVKGGKKKGDFLDALDEAVQSKLGSMNVSELKSLAKQLSLDISGKRKKPVLIELLLSSLTSDSLMELFIPAEEHSLEEIGEELVDIEKDVEAVVKSIEDLHTPEMSDLYEVDRKLEDMAKQSLDYTVVSDMLDMGRVKYMDGKYIEGISMLAEASKTSKEFFDNYQDITYAFLMLASEKILEECRDAESNDEVAADLLIDAKRAFSSGGTRREEATETLIERANKVYREELELLEREMDQREGMIKALKIQGVDVFNAERYLHRAREAFLAGELASSMSYLEKALNHANDSKDGWIEEIRQSVPRVEAIIQQASDLGADTSDAEKSLNQAKVALQNDDYSLCSELTKLAERKAMESQQGQIQKAAQLEREKLGDAGEIIAIVAPLVQEAQLYDLDVQQISWSLQEAKDALKNNDYVDSLSYARQAESQSKHLTSQLEAERERVMAAGGEFKPCQLCNAEAVKIFDSGWARCMSCGQMFEVKVPGKKKKWGLFGK